MAEDQEKETAAPLEESAFIHEGYRKNPYPLWLWLALSAVLLALLWGGGSWYAKRGDSDAKDLPFFQVTNRQFSLFLWQNPAFMRRNVSHKEGYLPGFKHLEKVSMNPELADLIVEAPPKILFLYHNWNRLVAHELIAREIPSDEFAKFLLVCEEWQPRYWGKAPISYVNYFEKYIPRKGEDLQLLPLITLPNEVRLAFQGWKNYTLEGEAINRLNPNFEEMRQFLSAYPHYSRPYWKNLVDMSGKSYLKAFLGKYVPSDTFPKEDLPPFLKVAFYNWKNRSKKT